MELYVHLPFCRQKCRYCDFASFPGEEGRMEAYVNALLREAEIRLPEVQEPLSTVYFGGGTPSLLPDFLLTRLVNGLKASLPMNTVQEWTVEANPGTVSSSWLETAAFLGINRLSLGMQAAQDHLLHALGRIHCMKDVVDSIRMARAAGFINLNLDLIFGLPGQSMSDWVETLDRALDLDPPHVSAYGLIPEEGTPLWTDLKNGRIFLPEVEEEREMYDYLLRKLSSKGFHQYEISNFARNGYECVHNIGYWRQIPYLGLGLSAASMTGLVHSQDGLHYLRSTNTRDMDGYIHGILAGYPVLEEKNIICPADARFETMMLGLRMNSGVRSEEFKALHGCLPESCFGDKLRMLTDRGLLQYQNHSWQLTREGQDLQNTVLVELMD